MLDLMIARITIFQETNQWDQWEESPVVVIPDKPVDPIQQKIEQYRQQIAKPPEAVEEEPQNYFEVSLLL